MSDYDSPAEKKTVPSDPSSWTESRRISSRFLEQVLTDKAFYSHLRRPTVTISGMWVREDVDLDDLTVGPTFEFRESRFERNVSFERTDIQGDVDFNGSELTNGLNLNEAQIAGDLFLESQPRLASLSAKFAKVGGNVELEGARIARIASLEAISVGGDVFLDRTSNFGSLEVNSADFSGSVYIEATIQNDLQIWSSAIGQDLKLLDGSIVGGELDGDLVSVGRNFAIDEASVAGVASFHSARVEGDLSVTNSNLVRELDLRHIKVGGQLDIGGNYFREDVRCSGSSVQGILVMTGFSGDPHWADKSTLDLSATSVGGINDSETAWASHLAMGGFTFGSGLGEDIPLQNAESKSFLERPGRWHRELLSRSAYSQPAYQELEASLRSVGNTTAADELAIAGKDRAWEGSFAPVQWLDKYLVGYGFRPWNSALPAVLLVLVGAALIYTIPYDERAIPSPVILSLQRLIPLVSFGENYSKFDLTSGAVPRYVRRYFYVHSFSGYVLTAFLLAGLARVSAVG